MRIEKLEYSGRKGERVLARLEGGSTLTITENEVLQFGLCAGLELDPETEAQLAEAGKLASAKSKAAEFIGRRPLSRKELIRKLTERGIEEERAEQAADDLERIGALDDRAYARMLVSHYVNLGYGLQKLREELYRRGVPRDLWEEALETAPPAEERIEAILRRRGSGPMDRKELERTAAALQRKGFSWQEIWSVLRKYEEDGWEEDV